LQSELGKSELPLDQMMKLVAVEVNMRFELKQTQKLKVTRLKEKPWFS
jgi:hypothetical protein